MRPVLALVLAAGCTSGSSDPQRGVARPGADCVLVAEALTTIELGNYAPREERTARERELVRACTAERLTREEGACIVSAGSKDEVAWCPKPLIVKSRIGETTGSGSGSPLTGICGAYVRTLERFARCTKLPAETARSLQQQLSQLRAMYAQYATSAPDSMLQSCQMANDATTKAMIQIGC